MKVLKSANIFFKLAFVGYLLFSVAPTTQGFTTSPHYWGTSSKVMNRELISKVHKPSWKIAYRYGAECKLEDRAEDKILEEAITAALNAWLQPLRDMKPARPITSVFHFQRQRDLNGDLWADDRIEGLLTVDVRVTFRCESEFSTAVLSGPSPDIYIRSGAKLTPLVLSHLTHELGHAFGLWDTYISAYRGLDLTTSGGLARTIGPQPSSWQYIPQEIYRRRDTDWH